MKAYDLLLRVEAEARQAQTVGELAFLIANETIRIAKCRQVFVLAGRNDNLLVKAVTSVGSVDRNSPRDPLDRGDREGDLPQREGARVSP
ncbi:hypothetical protein N7E02_13880 [Aliirhizobium terrae]|uniref:hypothetical protein n=1 Tax=Terrirhizobium terrae TaxID=2926709 RepID=UPI0025770400|nr:hypothetical protein [Rhizobium sp. CC-CFT758]WJH41454.1 hypothetical protein N7E02_13880 [Rhizobium sp. CC-CFT758]